MKVSERDRRARGQALRERVAYLRIGRGLMLKECADVMGIPMKSAAEHWQNAKAVIRGVPFRWRLGKPPTL